MDQISREQLQKGDFFRKQFEDEIYKNNIKKYTNDVVSAIAKDIVSTQNHRTIPRYIYRFGKPYILGHPEVPPSINNSLRNVYQNDVEHIYPVHDIYNALVIKFPDSKVTMDKYSFNITIDWS